MSNAWEVLLTNLTNNNVGLAGVRGSFIIDVGRASYTASCPERKKTWKESVPEFCIQVTVQNCLQEDAVDAKTRQGEQ